jgi:hypothetical protein
VVAVGGKGGDGGDGHGGKGGEGGVAIIIPKAALVDDAYPDSPQGLLQQNADLKKRNAELEAELELSRGVRESIVNYLEYVGSKRVGSLLSDSAREAVRWCSLWIRDELDVKWAKSKRELLPAEEKKDG